ncbi:MAG: hypothetical protein H6706_25150 [Myxococcales bacterium]|nr:hypothetical protein [Myxococcales bacterium]
MFCISPTSVAADLANSTIVFDGPDGRLLADQAAASAAALRAGVAGPGGDGGSREAVRRGRGGRP